FNIIDNQFGLDVYFDLSANINLTTIAEFRNIELYFSLTSKDAYDSYSSQTNVLNRARMANIYASLGSGAAAADAWDAYYAFVVNNNYLAERERIEEVFNRLRLEYNYLPDDARLKALAWDTSYGEVGDYILGDILSLY